MDFTKDIYINKDIIHENSEIVILYKGLLFGNNLANDIYISYGYGDMWENKNEIKMKPSTFGYLATIPVGTGKTLQFCFRNNENNWDNNQNENYILPIQEAEENISLDLLNNLEKESKIEIATLANPLLDLKNDSNETESQNLLETTVVSSDTISLPKTISLENISTQTIPNNTIYTKIKINENNENVVLNSVIQSNQDKTQFELESFTDLTEKAKQQSVKAFDEGKLTAGSVYVNSLVKEISNETPQENTLIAVESSQLKKPSVLNLLITNIKLAFSKLIQLIKSTVGIKRNNEE